MSLTECIAHKLSLPVEVCSTLEGVPSRDQRSYWFNFLQQKKDFYLHQNRVQFLQDMAIVPLFCYSSMVAVTSSANTLSLVDWNFASLGPSVHGHRYTFSLIMATITVALKL